MKTQTFFEPEADRYAFDFRLCTSARGWAQVDTRQDAPYYGNWANPVTRQLLSYAEGDVTLRTFDSDAEFIAAVRDFVGWAGSDWRGIDCMCRDELTQRFESLGLADLLH